MANQIHPLIGKYIREVYLASDNGAIRFIIDAGANTESIIARADGDCCSHSWVEGFDNIAALIDGRVTSVEDIDMPDQPYNEDEHECLRFYGCKITTNLGVCVIDYRNSSNGYYGGSLVWPSGSNYDPFYGGVHGQNISNNKWERVI